MPFPVQAVLRCVTNLVTPGRTTLVGIDGGAGAGKTTFARWLTERIRESGVPVAVVPTDRIYRPVAERWTGSIDEMPVGYDLDWERLRDEVILPLRAGQVARFRLYDWVEDRPGETVEIEPGGVTIIDGVFALRNELASHHDLRVWFACPLETRIARLLGRGDTPQAEIDSWLPVEERYHAAHEPEASAHLVIDSAGSRSGDDVTDGLTVVRWPRPDPGREGGAR